MERPRISQSTPGQPNDHWHAAAPAIPDLGGVVHQLIEAGGDEVVELHLDDRALTKDARADRDPEDRALRDWRVHDSIAEFVEQRPQEQERVSVLPTNVLAEDEHPRVSSKRVTDAEHHTLEKGLPFPIEGAERFEPRHWVRLAGAEPIGIQHVDTDARGLPIEHADANNIGGRPVGLDDELRLGFDDFFHLAFPVINRRCVNQADGFEPRRIRGNWIAWGPVLVMLAVDVSAVGQRRVSPAKRRVLAEIQHVVMVRVAAHSHGDELDECGPTSIARAFDRPIEGSRNRVRIGSVDRDPGDSIADRLVREDADCGLITHGGGQRGLVILERKHGGQFPDGAQVDRFVPLAKRGSAFANKRHGYPTRPLACERERETRNGDRPGAERSDCRPDPVLHVADVQILSVHRRAGLPHLCGQNATNHLGLWTHRDGHGEIADERRNDIPSPLVAVAILVSPAEADGSPVDRLLPQRTKSLTLENRVTVSHFAVGEECLQPIVGGPGDQHPPKYFEPFFRGEGGTNRGAPQKPVTRIDNVFDRVLEALRRRHAGCGIGHIYGGQSLKTGTELARKGFAKPIDAAGENRVDAGGGGQRFPGRGRGKWIAFEDERTEFPSQRVGNRFRPVHAAHPTAVRKL